MRLGCVLVLIRVLFASGRAYKVRKRSHNLLKNTFRTIQMRLGCALELIGVLFAS